MKPGPGDVLIVIDGQNGFVPGGMTAAGVRRVQSRDLELG